LDRGPATFTTAASSMADDYAYGFSLEYRIQRQVFRSSFQNRLGASLSGARPTATLNLSGQNSQIARDFGLLVDGGMNFSMAVSTNLAQRHRGSWSLGLILTKSPNSRGSHEDNEGSTDTTNASVGMAPEADSTGGSSTGDVVVVQAGRRGRRVVAVASSDSLIIDKTEK